MWGDSAAQGSGQNPGDQKVVNACRTRLSSVAAFITVVAVGCGGAEPAQDASSESESSGPTPQLQSGPQAIVGDLPGVHRLITVEGFDLPESMRHYPADDVYFVSNIGSHPTRIDNDGFISRLLPDGTIDEMRFIAGGVDGVTLNAPKGMRVLGDTLWVTDVTVVRAFHAGTGEALFSVDLADRGAVFLNALDRGGDGAMYVTDSGLRFNDDGSNEYIGIDRIFRIDPSGETSVAIETDRIQAPNGIDWDDGSQMFVVASRNGTSLWAWPIDLADPVQLVEGPSGYDGALSLPDGRVFASSWGQGDVQMLWSTGGLQSLIGGLEQPADIGFDLGRNRMLIPMLGPGRVEVWQLQ